MIAVIVAFVLIALLVLGAVFLERGIRRTERMSQQWLDRQRRGLEP